MERIKFTTSFPRDFHPDIVTAMDEHENLCNWVHLPVQSGSDKILRAMRRGHTRNRYLEKIEAIRNARRRMAITTDIIVGFPGETEADFLDTVSLIEAVQYDSLYAFKYSVRSGTPAASLPDDVPDEEKTRRLQYLLERQYATQSKALEVYRGRVLKVLVEGRSKRNPSEYTGHSTCQKVLNFPADESMLGQVVNVRVREIKRNSMSGTIEPICA